jgi:hypothetical protein
MKNKVQNIFLFLVVFYWQWICIVCYCSFIVFTIFINGCHPTTTQDINYTARYESIISRDKQIFGSIIFVYRQDGVGICVYVVLKKYKDLNPDSHISQTRSSVSNEPMLLFYQYRQYPEQKIDMNSIYFAHNECLIKISDISLYDFFEVDHDNNIKNIKQKLSTVLNIEF